MARSKNKALKIKLFDCTDTGQQRTITMEISLVVITDSKVLSTRTHYFANQEANILHFVPGPYLSFSGQRGPTV